MCALLMITSGCSTPVLKPLSVPWQENQLTECPKTLPRLAGPTGADFDAALRTLTSRYTECAARHNSLVETIRNTEKLQ
ncbi:hypothetical protein LT810_005106 [Escherichia coli]|nr:hypothetical protein [Escherichia coli]EIP9060375.1 hypothetical protein [Escherichia coli]HBC3224518.1 hypothetical protein [Escherichia coli O146]